MKNTEKRQLSTTRRLVNPFNPLIRAQTYFMNSPTNVATFKSINECDIAAASYMVTLYH